MQAAAHTPGGFGGVPQEVGKEFVGDSAGIAFISKGKILLLKRGDGGDYPGHWAFPGGHAEAGETPEDTARREALEETGYAASGALRSLSRSWAGDSAFCTFGKAVAEPFAVALCDESTDSGWFGADELPEPLHPGVRLTIDSGVLAAFDPAGMDELQLAREIRDGYLPSPIWYENMALFAMRITGTGTAYRHKLQEFVYRPPENYLTDEFLQRCNGLAVIFEHPQSNMLDSTEFAKRAVGTILLPYLQGDEVWGIAKIYDSEAIRVMTEQQMSTSPAVVFRDPDVNLTAELEDGQKILIEGKPSLLDHLAICAQGVWDKGGPPTGVLTNSEAMMSEETETKEEKAKADADMPDLKSIADSIGKLAARMDSMEGKMGEAKELYADKRRGDAAEEEDKPKEEAKADSALVAQNAELRERLAALEKRMPAVLTDSDYESMAAMQARADRVYSAFGDSAPRPLQGETPAAYRRRLIAPHQKHSKQWAQIDLAAIGDSALEVVENQIFADAMTAAESPMGLAGGELREIKSRSAAGHSISTFQGDPGAWTRPFKLAPRHVQKINKEH